MKLSTHNYINGEWIAAGNAAPNVSPSNTDDIIAEFPLASAADTEAAIEAARQALPKWRDVSLQTRVDLLERIGTILIARKDEIGRLLAREEGKTLAEGIGETVRAGQVFKFFAQEAIRITGNAIGSVRPDVDVEITREPVGVVGIITPWNFPIAIPAWKIAPALAYGNCVVLKPAQLTPACGYILAEIIHEAGAPAGVFNLVTGRGSQVGQTLVDHPAVNAISFTGSVSVGRALAASAANGLKKIQMEMGGKNPMVIMADADLDLAVGACLNSAFFSTGQRCTASSRLIVDASVHDSFVDKLTTAMKALKVGDALDPETQIGPVASSSQLNNNLSYVDLAAKEGATVIGGEQLSLDKNGYYQAPALFINADNSMRIAREEIFGPCATVIKADGFEEALAIANDTEFGLSAGICTTSLKHARDFKRYSQSGMVMVNLPTAGVDYHVPFGGTKASSYGSREQGRQAVEFYTTTKTAYTYA